MMTQLQTVMKKTVKEEIYQVELDTRALRSSANKEYKEKTDEVISQKVLNPKSDETLEFLHDWQKKVEAKKNREMVEE